MSKLVGAGDMPAQALEDHPMFDLLNEAEAHKEFKRPASVTNGSWRAGVKPPTRLLLI